MDLLSAVACKHNFSLPQKKTHKHMNNNEDTVSANLVASDQEYDAEEQLPLHQTTDDYHTGDDAVPSAIPVAPAVNTEQQKPFGLLLQDAVGWLSFSVVFNLLNTIVYSALFPKILEGVTTDKNSYATAFSIINFISTLASAILLPLIGSVVDQLNLLKPCLIVSQYIGLFVTLLLFVFDKVPESLKTLHLVLNEIVFIIAMFFLRIAVMNNNAMLSIFPKSYVFNYILYSFNSCFSSLTATLLFFLSQATF